MVFEDSNVEYKSEIPKNEYDLKAEIVSFLNNKTMGTIYLGSDDDGNPIEFLSEGEKREKYKQWEEKLSNWVKDAFEPNVVGFGLATLY